MLIEKFCYDERRIGRSRETARENRFCRSAMVQPSYR